MIGMILGHKYRVTELLGTGGMAHVYKAYNLATRRTVAIKVLKEEYRNNAEFLRRFEREARAVLHLTHENIVRAYGVGDVNGMPYIVLEYVDGRTLKDLIVESGAMPPRIAIGLVMQVLDALNAAHSAGIIHRDVKPQNVIVTKSGKAKLTDFGIARDVDATTNTFAGSTVLGSVHYLSPEQAMGKPVTESSDIYSLGVMLYEMLVGDVPFTSDNTVSVALMHISDDPVAPIQRNPKIPPSLNDIVLRAMNKNSAARYQSATAMQRHLQRSLKEPNGGFARAGAQETVTKDKAQKRSKRRRFRHGVLAIGIAVATVVLLLVAVFIGLRPSFMSKTVSTEFVPALTERSVEEARQKANNYHFEFEILEYEASDTVPYGHVIMQSPVAGTKAMLGTVIQVIVSIGPDFLTMPDLTGKTLDEAIAALAAIGLSYGNVDYRVSDVAIGYVCSQSILPGVEVQRGQRVDISISASSADGIPMPDLSGLSLGEALTKLDNGALLTIFVRYNNNRSSDDFVVLDQSPATDSNVQPSTPIYLRVGGAYTGDYIADVAYNIDVPESGTTAMVVMVDALNGVNYYHVLYETTLEKGEHVPISFTAYSDFEGTRELILYVNGSEYKRQDVGFLKQSEEDE